MRKWQTIRASAYERHFHGDAYAALVLSGGYEEAGDLGRFHVRAGDVVLHDQFEAHQNRFPPTGAKVLNLRLPSARTFRAGLASVPDPELIVRAAEKNYPDAVAVLLSAAEMREPPCSDWPDELASRLVRNPSLSLSHWSEASGIALWEISRGFFRAFGISPSGFRARARARLAWKMIRSSDHPLATIAAHLGFADQAHMTRSVKSFAGMAPQACRISANRFNTH